MNKKALFQIPYGLYLLSAHRKGADNACIINTLAQVTDSPARISICVNKSSLTHDLILWTGVFNVSMIAADAPFSLFEHFGFHSGRDVNKFQDYTAVTRTGNGLLRLTDHASAFVSGKVVETVELGTHTLFIADLTDAEVLSDTPTMTYSDYHSRVKPQPKTEPQAVGYRCRICGYVYEGAELPENFVCPLCKHGADDFECLKANA